MSSSDMEGSSSATTARLSMASLSAELFPLIVDFLDYPDKLCTVTPSATRDNLIECLRDTSSVLHAAPLEIRELWKSEWNLRFPNTEMPKGPFDLQGNLWTILEYLDLTKELSVNKLAGDPAKQQYTWPMGSGVIENGGNISSPVLFSSPYWDAKLIKLCKEWFDPQHARLDGYFAMDEHAQFDPNSNMGLLHWPDGNVLRWAHETFEIVAGFGVCWERPAGALTWLSSSDYFRSEQGLQDNIDASGAAWLTQKDPTHDNHMPCYFSQANDQEIEAYANIVAPSKEELMEHIRKIVSDAQTFGLCRKQRTR